MKTTLIKMTTLSLSLCFGLCQCVSPHSNETMELKEAILYAMNGIRDAHREWKPDPKHPLGMKPKKATIVFNVEAVATRGTEGEIGLNAPTVPVSLKVTNKSSRSLTRGNTITIEMEGSDMVFRAQ